LPCSLLSVAARFPRPSVSCDRRQWKSWRQLAELKSDGPPQGAGSAFPAGAELSGTTSSWANRWRWPPPPGWSIAKRWGRVRMATSGSRDSARGFAACLPGRFQIHQGAVGARCGASRSAGLQRRKSDPTSRRPAKRCSGPPHQQQRLPQPQGSQGAPLADAARLHQPGGHDLNSACQ